MMLQRFVLCFIAAYQRVSLQKDIAIYVLMSLG